ncbi:MAG TPA: hypothetical protein VGV87_28215 [Blastocatellia bacterium]|nr:hypothetical protein [Blastocatellia bacterium]
MRCTCIGIERRDREAAVDAFKAVRDECVALKDLLAPDESFAAITADAARPNSAAHRSCLLLALERGCLHRVTWPMHHFLFRGREVHPALTKQYREDLRERWLLENDEIQRQKRFRAFFGKLVELQVAHRLTELGWRVTDLEALGSNCDIAARSPSGVPYSIEVKYIGQGDDHFRLVFDALNGGTGVGSLPLYGAVNYLLFRAYEIAASLRDRPGLKMAILVVDGQTWLSLEEPLANRWLDWANPGFLQTEERDWNEFLAAQRVKRYPAIDTELRCLLRTLNLIWVMKLGDQFEYSVEQEARFSG